MLRVHDQSIFTKTITENKKKQKKSYYTIFEHIYPVIKHILHNLKILTNASFC